VIEYYVSLKTNPFVILAGPEGSGKNAFVQQFAEALVGPESLQFACIPGVAHWAERTGEHQYFNQLHERFGSWRFLELLQDAAAPANEGKLYLACFSRLRPDELEYYFNDLLQVLPNGEKRLRLPGIPPEEYPIVPPNLLMTATIDAERWEYRLSDDVLRHAGLIAFRSNPVYASASIQAPALRRTPPVGYQRFWLRAALRCVADPPAHLARALGPDEIRQLRCSPDLEHLLRRAGIDLSIQPYEALTAYVANSFDESGRGLFEPYDQRRNAQLALDAQVVQRVLWRLRATTDCDLQRDLTRYLDRSTQPTTRHVMV
jgi:hypothetical protein